MGEIIENPPTVPNTVTDSWQPLVGRDTMSFYGMNVVTLTNWDIDSTGAPQIAQGSAIDIDGSIARFVADEAIGGSPADGTIFLKLVVSGTTVTGEWTNEFPAWYADKGGWYNASGDRYTGHRASLSGTTYTNKIRYRDEEHGNDLRLGDNDVVVIGDMQTVGTSEADGSFSADGDISADGNLDVGGTGVIDGTLDAGPLNVRGGITENSSSRTWVGSPTSGTVPFPAGLIYYILSGGTGTGNHPMVEVRDSGGTWRTIARTTDNSPTLVGTLLSNGVDYRYDDGLGDVEYMVIT